MACAPLLPIIFCTSATIRLRSGFAREKQTRHADRDQEHRGQREDGVKRGRSREAKGIVVSPLQAGGLQELPSGIFFDRFEIRLLCHGCLHVVSRLSSYDEVRPDEASFPPP